MLKLSFDMMKTNVYSYRHIILLLQQECTYSYSSTIRMSDTECSLVIGSIDDAMMSLLIPDGLSVIK